MTKAFFYETDGGDLLRCMFAGLDHDGHAQWVVINQGSETMTLQDYQDEYLIESGGIHLLCLEGEPLESVTLAILLGCVLQSYPINRKKSLSETLQKLRNMGVDWKHDMVRLNVHAHKYFDDVLNKECYNYSIIANGRKFLLDADAFSQPEEMMADVRCFFDALEQEADVVLKKVLVLDPNGDIELDSKDCTMFDVVS